MNDTEPRPEAAETALPSFSHSDSCERYYAADEDMTAPCTCGATKAQEWLDALVVSSEKARLLGPARAVLDKAAEGEVSPEECAAMAQRIVNVIGHSVTDEPPHALIDREAALRDVWVKVHAIRFDHENSGGNVGGPDNFYNGVIHAERVIQRVLGFRPGSVASDPREKRSPDGAAS